MTGREQIAVTYVSSLITEEDFSRAFDGASVVPSMAAQKFHRLLAEGLAHDPRVSRVNAVSSPPISRRLTSQVIHPPRHAHQFGVHYTSVPFVNAPVLRQACTTLATAVLSVRQGKRNDHFIVCDALCGGPSIGALLAGRITRTPVVAILTDIPQHRPAVGTRANRVKSALVNRVACSWLPHFDAYLVLTEAMNPIVNPRKKPHRVMEGLVDAAPASDTDEGLALSSEGGARVILYTGSTHRIYGLPLLIEAFLQLDPQGWELHICGQGDMDEELRRVAERHPNITFLGIIPNREAVVRQRRASLLVNPRPTQADYTKYSFPSKNMEYMASGTPVLTTNLPGMPPDYHKHVFLLHDETIAGFRQALASLTSMSDDDLEEKGRSARRFVLGKKNNHAQAGRLVDLMLVKDRHTFQTTP